MVRDLEIEGVLVDRIAIAVPMRKLSLEARRALKEVARTRSITLHPIADRIGLGIGRGADARSEFDLDVGDVEFTAAELRLVASRSYLHWKRAMDAVAAGVAILLLSPLIAIVAALVAIDVGAPIMFAQRRPGLWGRPFRIYKFRTMAAAYDHEGCRLDDSDRISPIGKALRRFRLDELPQLFNVLVGDMSFVGPRPLLPIDQHADFKARLLVRPGITGWAQVEGGRIVEPVDKAVLDIWYVQKASLLLDLRVIAMTLPMLFRGDRINDVSVERAWQDLVKTGIGLNWSRAPRRLETSAVAASAAGLGERKTRAA
ncbi:MAG: sugar transferase [Hyphomicrobiaceae bacterium]